MEHIISEWIVNKYESSSKFRENRRDGKMSVNLNSKKEYNDTGEYKFRFKINDSAVKLQKQNLIKIVWYEKDNIIEKIQFDLKDMDSFYRIAGVRDKGEILEKVSNEIDGYIKEISQQWIILYFKELKDQMKIKRKLPSIFENIKKKDLIVLSLKGIDELLNSEGTMLERVFSKKYLKGSKTFEKEVRRSIISIIKKYKEDISKDFTNEEILKEVGIEKTTNELFLKGSIKIILNNEIIDLSKFIYGIGLTTETLRHAEIFEINSNTILSVENKANFLYECDKAKEDEMIIFSSGFYSPVQRNFLKKIRGIDLNKGKEIKYYHSGDFDFGGINIYRHIKNKIFPELQPYKMDLELYIANMEFTEVITDDSYIDKLRKLLEDESCIEFIPLIQRMVFERRTLEQESLLVD